MPTEQDGTIWRILEKLEDLAKDGDPKARSYVNALREELQKEERSREEQRQLMAKYEEAYQKLTSPANKIGVFLKHLEDGEVLVVHGDAEYVALVDPAVQFDDLKPGVRIKLNEAYAVIGVMPESETGAIIKVSQVLADGRLRVGADQQNSQGRLITRADSLSEATIKTGDEVRLDSAGRIAVEHFVQQAAQDYFIEEIPETPWSAVGGQEEAISLVKETIEQPLLYPELYAAYDKKPVKGILLYGPPGCGKTLLGKAIAYNLAKDYSERTGKPTKECFLHISGPKILNMWLGETERMVREIFATAREKAKEGNIVVVFIDEAESVLRTRSNGRWLNISNTVVPQFCAEMDGLVEMENVVIVLTSNRPDYIDPAILRPERIDRKVRIRRPDQDSARAILSIYLHGRLPLDPALVAEHGGEECARKALVEGAVAHLWRVHSSTEFLRIQTRAGGSQSLYWKDLVSGALLKSIVDRAKDTAIRRAIADRDVPTGIGMEDLQEAISAEYRENEIFPKSDAVEDWLKLLDFEPEAVVGIKPVGKDRGQEIVKKSVI
ncbi:MAG: AAA family ATPase [Armatimonadetes bacterium]|nr:AAA family ATPase [Armatimonadota bacterium]